MFKVTVEIHDEKAATALYDFLSLTAFDVTLEEIDDDDGEDYADSEQIP